MSMAMAGIEQMKSCNFHVKVAITMKQDKDLFLIRIKHVFECSGKGRIH
jgi:hypothetical protein